MIGDFCSERENIKKEGSPLEMENRISLQNRISEYFTVILIMIYQACFNFGEFFLQSENIPYNQI